MRAGLTSKEKRVVELAAMTIKAALNDLPNHRELCAAIVTSASLHRLDIERARNPDNDPHVAAGR